MRIDDLAVDFRPPEEDKNDDVNPQGNDRDHLGADDRAEDPVMPAQNQFDDKDPQDANKLAVDPQIPAQDQEANNNQQNDADPQLPGQNQFANNHLLNDSGVNYPEDYNQFNNQDLSFREESGVSANKGDDSDDGLINGDEYSNVKFVEI